MLCQTVVGPQFHIFSIVAGPQKILTVILTIIKLQKLFFSLIKSENEEREKKYFSVNLIDSNLYVSKIENSC